MATDGLDSAPRAPWPAPPSPAERGATSAPRPRRLLGWLLIVVGAAVIGGGALVGWRALVGPVERITAPGVATVDCRAGDHWRIGPLTSTSRTLGPLTVTSGSDTGGDATVTVTTSGGEPVDLSPMRGSETFSINGQSYTAALTFRCPIDGATTVAVDAAPGTRVAVFPSFGRTFRSLLRVVPVGVLGLASVAGGIVVLVRRRRVRDAAA